VEGKLFKMGKKKNRGRVRTSKVRTFGLECHLGGHGPLGSRGKPEASRTSLETENQGRNRLTVRKKIVSRLLRFAYRCGGKSVKKVKRDTGKGLDGMERVEGPGNDREKFKQTTRLERVVVKQSTFARNWGCQFWCLRLPRGVWGGIPSLRDGGP